METNRSRTLIVATTIACAGLLGACSNGHAYANGEGPMSQTTATPRDRVTIETITAIQAAADFSGVNLSSDDVSCTPVGPPQPGTRVRSTCKAGSATFHLMSSYGLNGAAVFANKGGVQGYFAFTKDENGQWQMEDNGCTVHGHPGSCKA